ncbi:hypothetical protein LCGC14_1290180 [marine sediment metagenome]|uniref:Uncharacterized protein n=1 Tax=marine sediment metagenome TaxID=412755 RepID=A0A0F9N9B6_9ZZZZ
MSIKTIIRGEEEEERNIPAAIAILAILALSFFGISKLVESQERKRLK